jgi:hypothetical protein
MPSMSILQLRKAIVGFPHDIKGNAVWFCNLKETGNIAIEKI